MEQLIKKYSYFLLTIPACFLLFGCISRHPYGYYIWLRWITVITSIVIAYAGFSKDKYLIGAISSALVIVFNPVIPVRMGRSLWVYLDLIAGLLLPILGFLVSNIKRTGMIREAPMPSFQQKPPPINLRTGPTPSDKPRNGKSGRLYDDIIDKANSIIEDRILNNELSVQISRFKFNYYVNIGQKLNVLNRVKLENREYQRRIELIENNIKLSNPVSNREVEERVKNEFKEIWLQMHEGEIKPQGDVDNYLAPGPDRDILEGEYGEKIKALYRKTAIYLLINRIYSDNEFKDMVNSLVNIDKTYKKGDIDYLKRIGSEKGLIKDPSDIRYQPDEKKAIERKLNELEHIEKLTADEGSQLVSSPDYQVFDRIFRGNEETFNGLRESTEKELFEEQNKLESLKEQYHRVAKTATQNPKYVDIKYTPTSRGLGKVAGMNKLKLLLYEDVIRPIREPEVFKRYGLTIPNGILLFGPPGCGKTYIAKQLAEEVGWYYKEVKGSDVGSPYIHGSTLAIRNLFDEVAENTPAMLFIDEIEGLVPKRSEMGAWQQHKSEEVNEFLMHFNESASKQIFIIGATNEPEKLDEALMRPGRLDKLIYVEPPDYEARLELLRMYLQNRPLAKIDLDHFAIILENYSCSDIKNVTDEAARLALKDNKPIDGGHLQEAIRRNPSSLKPDVISKYGVFCQRGI